MRFIENFRGDKKTITIEFEKEKDSFFDQKLVKAGVELLRI